MSWDTLQANTNKKLYLYDKELELRIDMQKVNKYIFKNNSNRNKFKIAYGDLDYVKDKLLPTEIKIGNIYPNPVIDNFYIPINLLPNKNGYDIQVIIYDNAGKEVFTQEQISLKDEYFFPVELSSDFIEEKGIYHANVNVKNKDTGSTTSDSKMFIKQQ